MTTPSKAAAFYQEHADYFFADAHFQVEAAASLQAVEVAHNVFEFPDRSRLVTDSKASRVRVLDEFA